MINTDAQRLPEAFKRSPCPIANALDIVGDKWTLLVVRDLFMGKSTYSELQKSPESIPTNLLADRLKRLEQGGIVAKQSYQQKPVRYAYYLTEKGKDLGMILAAMVKWGNRHIPETYVPDEPDKIFQSNPDK
jgi:DNA-binding HxlR family transcriptional regulator